MPPVHALNLFDLVRVRPQCPRLDLAAQRILEGLGQIETRGPRDTVHLKANRTVPFDRDGDFLNVHCYTVFRSTR